MPYLAPWDIVSLRESKSVCRKWKSGGSTEAMNTIIIIMSSIVPIGHPAGLCQDGGGGGANHLPSRAWVEVVTCGLLALSSGGAAPSPPKEPKHFHRSHLKRKEISITANLPYGRGVRPWISRTFYPITVSIVHHLKIKQKPYDQCFLSLWKKTLIKKILGLSGYVCHLPWYTEEKESRLFLAK